MGSCRSSLRRLYILLLLLFFSLSTSHMGASEGLDVILLSDSQTNFIDHPANPVGDRYQAWKKAFGELSNQQEEEEEEEEEDNRDGDDTPGLLKSSREKSEDKEDVDAERFKIWKETDNKIQLHNSQPGVTFRLGHNRFSTMTDDKFARTRTGGLRSHVNRKNREETTKKKKHHTLPVHRQTSEIGFKEWEELRNKTRRKLEKEIDSIDWVAKGAVNPPKDQGNCGSCWAFATSGALEAAYQIGGGELKALSPQDLISCDKIDDGCNGGNLIDPLKWVKKHGIMTNENFGYTSGKHNKRGQCPKNRTPTVGIHGYTSVKNQDHLLAVLRDVGPVAVGLGSGVIKV